MAGKWPEFYCCYLLQSVPKPGSFYIGSTPDPFRRLRQHNGELTQGAFKTKSEKKRPWRMICLVCGFQSKIAALQFEHAWQHPYQTRHISVDRRITTSRRQTYGSLDNYIGNMRLLITADAFNRLPLKVYLFEESSYMAWTKNKHKLQDLVAVELDLRTDHHSRIGGGKLILSPPAEMSEYYRKSCRLVDKNDRTILRAVCPNASCNYVTSLVELAKQFLRNDHDQVVPVSGICPECGKKIQWHIIARNAFRLKATE
jgi:structure-specific endonuclease subunit SLX1